MKNSKRQYIAPTYSQISLDETSAMVALSPPTDSNEGTEWWASADLGEESKQKISPFVSQSASVIGTGNSSPFGNSGSPF